jgi:hypothetical protein
MVSTKALPRANKAITPAPSSGLLLKAATNKAAYNKPHGSKDHNTPNTTAPPCRKRMCAVMFCTRRQIARPNVSNQMGCSARHSNSTPTMKANK